MRTGTTIGVVGLLLLSILGTAAEDIRIVGNKQVDLAPLRTWLATRKGERPLPHWKELTFFKPLQPIGAWGHYQVSIEDVKQELLVNNVPNEITQHFAQLARLDSQIGRLSDYVKKETRRIDDLHAAVPTGSPAGSHDYIRAKIEFRAKAKAAENELKPKQEELERLIAARDEEQKKEMKDLAMFTGHIYSKLQIWDCGKRP